MQSFCTLYFASIAHTGPILMVYICYMSMVLFLISCSFNPYVIRKIQLGEENSNTLNYSIIFIIHESKMKNYALYSNEPEAVYILTNLKTRRSPVKTFYNSPQLYINNPKQDNVWLAGQHVCLVWFNNANRTFLFTVDELKNKINMTEIAALKDGRIYTFRINKD